ncbi:MAG: MaoC family dehydratase N-terminal domain-containing protein [Chloroflexi bacterium]|nr:MaoC family dehydratase N-terminal domain-containing protein [Chloroflexota bacterium]
MKLKYFEDYEVGQTEIAQSYIADKEEMIACARKWDPQPFHVDEEAAKASIYGGITAPSIYTMAITDWLGHQFEYTMVSLGLLGYDHMEFPNPVRPGDTLIMSSTVIEKRESQTKPDRGVVRFNSVVSNQKDEPVLTFEAKVMMAKRH